ncbi:MAG: hypothetical protein KAG18_02365 [Sinobacterium sp.]|nr:hypothetical protein [Sinobacterium sp.]
MNVSAKQLKKQRLELILLFALPVLGILLTTAYYFYIVENQEEVGTHNKGELVAPPKPTTELLLNAGDKPFKINDGSGKWTFLVVGNSHCDETCVSRLYFTRQVKQALGKYKLRIQNVYLIKTNTVNEQPNSALATLLSDEYSEHKLVSVDAVAFDAWAEQNEPSLQSLPGVQFYVVDPAGWLMMYYSQDNDYKQVISDMKFLIKNS